ncbi:MAG: hypothetical protein H8D45_31875, partial [Bacteroidetes bacterium]|nr:hypothetical protein [Bacteroidota bacterium]
MKKKKTNLMIYTIKKLFIMISFLVFSNSLNAQIIQLSDINPYHLKSTNNFFEIQRAMNEYWSSQNVKDGYTIKNGEETKVPNWKIYKRWEYYWEQRVNQTTGEFPRTNSIIEYDNYRKKPNNFTDESDYSENWVNLGTNTSSGGYAGLGRINCVAFHPTDNNTVWVGSPSGGIWKTTNGGTNWTILNDNLSVLGVSDIIVSSDYATSNTIYIATGDRDGGSMWSLGGGQYNDNNSIGVLKSTDGGATWNLTELSYSTSDGKLVYKLLIHPTDNSILLASTSDGIYKTTNGGTNWTLKTINQWIDMEFNPADPNIICASSVGYGSSYINRSTNNGENWSYFIVASGGYRNELAVTPDDATVVYMLSSNISGGLNGVYKSTNSGASFSRVDSPAKSMLYYYSDGSGANVGQGTYDLCIAASPTDANTVFLGGINTWKSINGGVAWTINNMWTSSGTYNFVGAPVAYADKHVFAFQNGTTLFEGNDGGIYKTINGGTTWTDLTNGIVISQIYRIGVSQTDADVVLTGLQDNGSKKYRGALNTWFDATGGDGMECIIDFNNATSYMYATYVNGTIYRNTNGFTTTSRTTISANIPGGQPTGFWVTPYIMDPTDAAILFAGYDRVWKTVNRGNSWTSASQVLSSSAKLRSLAIAPSNTNVLYAADQTNMWKTTNGGATNWTSITLPVTSDYLTYITVKDTDPNTLWITFGGYTNGLKVYESTNGGTSWTNISTGLPNLPVMCIVYNKRATDRNVLFVGTDVGVYVKDGTDVWTSYNAGLPNVVVTELEIFYGGVTDKLRAGTFGRGLWETDIEAALPVVLSSFISTVIGRNVKIDWVTASEQNNYGFDIERKIITGNFIKIGFIQGKGTVTTPSNYFFVDRNLQTGIYQYRLKQIDFNGNIKYHNLSGQVEIGIP